MTIIEAAPAPRAQQQNNVLLDVKDLASPSTRPTGT